MTLLAAFQTLLYRYTGQEDISVGTPIANRTRAEIEGLIGFFVNSLVLRTNFKGNPSYSELIRRVQEVALGAYAHQDFPFEKLVVELLVAMGYGGSLKDAGEVLGKSGDGGIDGAIKEDRLGLDVVYVQAKRWDKGSVGRPDLQKFIGALKGQRANKGVFITTSRFSDDAMDYVSKITVR